MAKDVSPPAESASKYWFDQPEADRLVKFFATHCKHVKGPLAGKPFVLDEWQEREIIRPLFGWKRVSDNTRRYRRAYIEIPRKSGKSTLSAGLGIIGLTADREMGAEVYSAAVDRDQAAIVFDVAKSMVEASPSLSKKIRSFRRSMTVEATASSYKVLSSDAPSKHGFNASMILFDELHAQPNRELWDVLTTSTGARTQPLIIAITTAGYDRHSICWEQHEYAIKVRDGIIEDDSFLAVIYAADAKDDWTSPEVWAKANPGLNKSVTYEYLEAEAKRAAEVPAYQNTFRRLHLNQWTEQETRWLDMAVWERNCDEVTLEKMAGRECFAGLDLASSDDIAALCLVFPPKNITEKYAVFWWFWVPEDNAHERARRDRVPYEVWIRDGWIQATQGNVIDFDAIRRVITGRYEAKTAPGVVEIRHDPANLKDRFNIREIGYDRWGAQGISTDLQDDGVHIVPFGQGFSSMAGPTKELLTLLLAGQVAHGNNPVAKWMASNVTVRTDPAGNQKPDKGKSTERIDGIVAEIMALGRAMVQPEAVEPSISFLKFGA